MIIHDLPIKMVILPFANWSKWPAIFAVAPPYVEPFPPFLGAQILPDPRGYVRHTSRFLSLFMLTQLGGALPVHWVWENGEASSQQRWLFWRIRKWFCRSNRANARNRSAQMKILDQFPNIETHHNLPILLRLTPVFLHGRKAQLFSWCHGSREASICSGGRPWTIHHPCDLWPARAADLWCLAMLSGFLMFPFLSVEW